MLRGFNCYIRQLECAAYIVIVQQLSYKFIPFPSPRGNGGNTDTSENLSNTAVQRMSQILLRCVICSQSPFQCIYIQYYKVIIFIERHKI